MICQALKSMVCSLWNIQPSWNSGSLRKYFPFSPSSSFPFYSRVSCDILRVRSIFCTLATHRNWIQRYLRDAFQFYAPFPVLFVHQITFFLLTAAFFYTENWYQFLTIWSWNVSVTWTRLNGVSVAAGIILLRLLLMLPYRFPEIYLSSFPSISLHHPL